MSNVCLYTGKHKHSSSKENEAKEKLKNITHTHIRYPTFKEHIHIRIQANNVRFQMKYYHGNAEAKKR